jgi:hypothetical protein
MLAVKRGHVTTTRAILDFGVNPAIFLRKDVDASTPLHIAAQNANTTLAEVLLQYGPTEQLYAENGVGQTPLEIAGLKVLPREIGSEVPRPSEPQVNIANEVHSQRASAPFDVEKQKVEIPKLRATLDGLLADGRLVRGAKLTTELFAFAYRLEGKLAIEVARQNAARKVPIPRDDEDDHVSSHGTPASTYVLLRDAAAARPGLRQLVHLADVQRSVQRDLARQAEEDLQVRNQWTQGSEALKEADPEKQRITQLKERSLFGSALMDRRYIYIKGEGQVDIFGEDQL